MAIGKIGIGKKAKSNAKQMKEESVLGYLKLPDNIKIFKETTGDNFIDILFYKVTDEKHLDRHDGNEVAVPDTFWYKKPVKIHRNVGADNRTIICPTTFGLPCPVCELANRMKVQGASKEEIAPFRPKNRTLYYVVPRKHKDFTEAVHVWDISNYCFQDLLNTELETNNQAEGALEPDTTGKTLKLRVEEEKFDKFSFNRVGRIDFIPRKKDLPVERIMKLPSLDDMLVVLDYDTIVTLMGGSSNEVYVSNGNEGYKMKNDSQEGDIDDSNWNYGEENSGNIKHTRVNESKSNEKNESYDKEINEAFGLDDANG